MSPAPSAWEIVQGEAKQVSYWKYRVRRLESMTFPALLAAFILGFGACAVLVHLTRP